VSPALSQGGLKKDGIGEKNSPGQTLRRLPRKDLARSDAEQMQNSYAAAMDIPGDETPGTAQTALTITLFLFQMPILAAMLFSFVRFNFF
jgi:hypothetical protein